MSKPAQTAERSGRAASSFMQRPRVLLESPFASYLARNKAYARRCLRDSLRRGEAPFAMHLLYPQVLDDQDAIQRKQGFEAGLSWLPACELVAVYADYGVSPGMQIAIDEANRLGKPVEYRHLEVPDGPSQVK